MALLNRRMERGLTMLLLMIFCAQAHAADVQLEEYRVKAAFIYNFAKFVEWPSEAFDNSASPIRICTLGQNPFGSALEDAVKNKMVGERGLVVRQLDKGQEVADCHILFVSRSERAPLGSLVVQTKCPYVLTVGESEDFIGNGGAINLALKDSRIRIQINVVAAARGKFRISSKLLGIADIVKQ